MFTSFPQYYREYFYIFATTGKDVPYDMVDFLVKEFNLELVGDEITFIVKGSKDNVEKCVEKYQEFFESWEKIDKRLIEIYDKTDELISQVQDIPSCFDVRSGMVDKKKHNEYIEDIIDRLKKLKVL